MNLNPFERIFIVDGRSRRDRRCRVSGFTCQRSEVGSRNAEVGKFEKMRVDDRRPIIEFGSGTRRRPVRRDYGAAGMRKGEIYDRDFAI